MRDLLFPLATIPIVIGLSLQTALADDGDFAAVGHSGDGSTPTYLQHLDRYNKGAQASKATLQANTKGNAEYSIPIQIPTALHSPQLALVYSSGSNPMSAISPGWSLQSGLTITRPSNRQLAGAYADTPGAMLISGAGLSGLLAPDVSVGAGAPNIGSQFYGYVSKSPGAVQAEWDPDTDTWTVKAGGVTYTLAPRSDVDFAGLGLDPSAYRVVESVDATGNAVTYRYDGADLIGVSFGGNNDTADAHIIQIQLQYEDRVHARFDGSAGFVDVKDRRLTDILVQTQGDVNYVEAYRYELDYVQVDRTQHLETIVHSNLHTTDYTVARGERTVAEFEYSEYDSEPAASVQFDDWLGYSETYSPAMGWNQDQTSAPGHSASHSAMTDLNGDGLQDQIYNSTSNTWDYGLQRYDHWPAFLGDGNEMPFSWAEYFRFSMEPATSAHDGGGGPFHEVRTALNSEETRGIYTRTQTVDMDGDGYLDLISNLMIPQPFHEWPSERDPNITPRYDQSWTITYGGPFGFDQVATVMAPFAYSGMSEALRTPAPVPAGQLDTDPYVTADMHVSLMDMNADGWLDAVQTRDGTLSVWLRTPSRTGDFEFFDSPGMTFSESTHTAFTALRTTRSIPADLANGAQGYHRPTIVSVEEIQGFRDLNGDGLLDWVDASDPADPDWQVWFGTTSGLSPDVYEWRAPLPYLSKTWEGSPAMDSCTFEGSFPDFNDPDGQIRKSDPNSPELNVVVQIPDISGDCNKTLGSPKVLTVSLLDIDGDGRQDLVDAGDGSWWKNMGDRFAVNASDVPHWMPDGINVSHSIGRSDSGVVNGSPSATVALIESVDDWRIGDINNDGMPDVIEMGSQITYGSYPPPGLLTRATEGTGGTQVVTYRPASTIFPAGTDEECFMASQLDVVARTTVGDPVTNEWLSTSNAWFDGYCEGGVCWGFEQRDTYVHKVTDSGDIFQSLTETLYELHRDYALPAAVSVSTDAALGHIPELASGAVDLTLRLFAEYFYDDTDNVTGLTSRWLASKEVTEYGDTPAVGPVVSRTVTAEVDYDAVGNITRISHADSLLDQDATELNITWTPNTDDTYYAPSSQTKTGFVGGVWTDVETIEFDYDHWPNGSALDDGLMTASRLCAATPGASLCSETVDWSYSRGPRGQLSGTVGPLGHDMTIDGFLFGGAVGETAINALSHETTQTVDALGRVHTSTDPNGVVTTTTYDFAGRVLETRIQGVGGAEYLMSSVRYDDTVPASITTTTHNELGDVLGEEIEVLDGFGNVRQTWKIDEAGDHYIVTDSMHDLFGNLLSTSVPHRHNRPGVFPISYGTMTSATGEVHSSTAYDALGQPRVVIQDALVSGTTWVTYPEPNHTLTIDAVGFTKEIVHDSHGRISQVWEGRNGNLAMTGAYQYDPQGRIAGFLDANSNYYEYSHDGAGRLRTVERGLLGANPTPYYAYKYEDALPSKMYEGSIANGQLVAQWQYDNAARMVGKQVLNQGNLDDYNIVWDTHWLGARASTTDPEGTTEFYYDDLTGLGQMGHVSETTRTFSRPGTGAPKSFFFKTDLQGNAVRTVWPSGTSVDSTYSSSGWHTADSVGALDFAAFGSIRDALDSKQALSLIDATDFSYTYDQYGLKDGLDVCVDPLLGCDFQLSTEVIRESPAAVLGIKWLGTGIDERVFFDRYADGSIKHKRVHPFEPVIYDYDDLHRVNSVTSPWGDESYAYDNGGNLTAMARGNRNYSYDPAAGFADLTARRELGVITDSYTYDSVTSRMTSWTQESGEVWDYVYNGDGLATQVVRGNGNTRYAYDIDNEMTLRTTTPDSAPRTKAFWFNGWKYDEATDETSEEILPTLRLVNGEKRWILIEPDGHALAEYDNDGNRISLEIVGAYGAPLYRDGSPAPLSSFHGEEVDRTSRLMHMGARNLLADDGRWLQPEPFLHQGLPNDMLGSPRKYTGSYSAGDPLQMQDRSGFIPVLLVVAVPVAIEVGATLLDAGTVAYTAYGVYQGTATWTALGTEMTLAGAGMVMPGGGYSAAAHGVGYTADAARVTGSVVSKGADEVTTLHRAVGPDELADIKATGTVRPGGGGNHMEGKWFAESADDADTWGAMLHPDGDHSLIEADFPKSTADEMFSLDTLDGVGPARYAEEADLLTCCAVRVTE